ncbi:hypothetical protein KIN20_004656 [Parelaphostrongylus tenuis]|uniref:Uncharacterized protein n=1 Tax=Parelaphostrongylus tenuis TaxID=148309 RepID=A0AAD5LZ52_PARTN|nr:hypothetical protein KIN20_004656 [Parelaphostrongylus tenuis]
MESVFRYRLSKFMGDFSGNKEVTGQLWVNEAPKTLSDDISEAEDYALSPLIGRSATHRRWRMEPSYPLSSCPQLANIIQKI